MLPLLGALQEATRLGYYSITGQPAREVLDEPVTLGEGGTTYLASCALLLLLHWPN